MEAAFQGNSKVYKPFPHRDPYGLDSMYIAPLEEDEIWDLSSFRKPDILSFSMLTLRSLFYKRKFDKCFPLLNLNMEFRRELGRKSWNLDTIPEGWKGYFPQILGERKSFTFWDDSINIQEGFHWEDSKEMVGAGILDESSDEMFPKILDKLVLETNGRVYLRTSRQSFFYIPNIGENSKKGLFVQDKEVYDFPEFFYYWITLLG